MIKIIKQGTLPTKYKFEITCAKCGTIFKCDENDCSHVSAGQGFWAYGIHCPVCNALCTEMQGDPNEWRHVP